jgi:hypothetical protein
MTILAGITFDVYFMNLVNLLIQMSEQLITFLWYNFLNFQFNIAQLKRDSE